ncbi:MAG: cysteine synthase A [Peptostreptococcaceae bacterium]|nr:cysteine synthase A [Peptostreptococcaceae bacterium]
MIYDNITNLIGQTPIIKLNKLQTEDMADIYLKVESFNPGGSIKDRIALKMIEGMEERLEIKEGYTLVEPTSGNTGIGISMVSAYKGYDIILVMPDTMSIERRNLLKAYGAKLILTDGKLGMKGAIQKAKEIVSNNEKHVLIGQFENMDNKKAHIMTTAKEILNDFSSLDAFVAGVGTGGTISGVSEVLKKHYKNIDIVAIEPNDSAVLSGDKSGPHKIQGIGAGFIPDILNVEVIDDIVRVSNEEAINTMRLLAREEGILSGISSGAALFGALKIAKKLGKGKKVLVILPDTGERYLSGGVFND